MPRRPTSALRHLRSARTGALALAIGLGAALPLAALPRVAHADTEETREEARRLFSQGSSAFLARKYAEALDDLRASYKLVPSPNSGLLIARCLRELGRRVEAVDMYATVAADARRRAADGDAKYTQTADVAASEGAAVRATLGLLRVRVAHPAPDSVVEIDGVATPATESEIVVLHPPGVVTVKLKPRAGPEQSQRATLAAGGDIRMEFVSAAPTEGPPPPVPPPRPPALADAGEPPAWTLPAALVASGVALAGTGVFIGFRVKSDSIYNDLQQACAPKPCGEERRAASDTGKQDQTIADVGLVVGIVGAAAAVAFLLVRAYAPRSAAAAALTHGGLRTTF